MTTSGQEKQYPIPAALPAILKGFARETLRAQPQDIYKFAAQYFKELHASSAPHTQPEVLADDAANLQATILQHFLDEDRSNRGLLPRAAVKKALCARILAFSSRQVQIAVANCDEDSEGLVDYRSVIPHLSQLLLKSQQETDRQSGLPSLLRGQTSSEVEAQFVQACQHADSAGSGLISRQDFKTCLQSCQLTLCRKDVNVVLGEVEDGPIEYQGLASDIYQLLATRVEDELLLNENLASSKALSQHLAHLLQQPDSPHAGSASLPHLVQTLQALSRDCLGLTDSCLACIIGYTAPEAADSVVIQPWSTAAAAMMYSLLDPSTASTRHAALTEFRERDESERSRSANVQSVKDTLVQTFQGASKAGSGRLTKQDCLSAIKGPAADSLHLSPQESVALRCLVESNAADGTDTEEFAEQCSQLLMQLEEEGYMFQYVQAHA